MDSVLRPLFDGKTLNGWHAVPRLPVPRMPGGPDPDLTPEQRRKALAHTGRWTVEDAATTLEPMTPEKPALLEESASGEAFLKAWKWRDWNTFRIRVEGHSPRITVHVNDLLIARIDTASLSWPGYDPARIRGTLGHRGHIAFEVHDNDPGMGEARWGRNAACRWRNIRIRT